MTVAFKLLYGNFRGTHTRQTLIYQKTSNSGFV